MTIKKSFFTATNYKKAVEKQVDAFSFNPFDDAEYLFQFRRREQILLSPSKIVWTYYKKYACEFVIYPKKHISYCMILVGKKASVNNFFKNVKKIKDYEDKDLNAYKNDLLNNLQLVKSPLKKAYLDETVFNTYFDRIQNVINYNIIHLYS